ncbi:MAG TPA: MobB family relaxase [Cyclobacteriaceae bacterium]|nr:MobB family relaxase [Cyclobacteriaceae bacterium]
MKISTPPAHANKNTGSVRDLAQYLDKENIGKDAVDKQYFFNHKEDIIFQEEVIAAIDNNRKGLKKSETKFYEMSISFSERELNELHKIYPHRKDRHQAIRGYIRDSMNAYGVHFERGLTGDDLVYFGKIETNRRYHPSDLSLRDTYKANYKIKEEISELPSTAVGKIKMAEARYIRDRDGTVILPGNTKAGDNTHVHIVVSRRDAAQKVSLSPMANNRGGHNTLNGKKVKIGFDRDQFAAKVEELFDQRFQYNRIRTEKYRELRTAKIINTKVREMIHTVDEPDKFLERYATKLVKRTINKHLSFYLTQHGMKHLVLPIQQTISSNRANLVNLAARNLSNSIVLKGAVHGLATTIPTPVGVVVKAITVAHSLLSDAKTKGRDKGMALER